jgi:hypothetical protein
MAGVVTADHLKSTARGRSTGPREKRHTVRAFVSQLTHPYPCACRTSCMSISWTFDPKTRLRVPPCTYSMQLIDDSHFPGSTYLQAALMFSFSGRGGDTCVLRPSETFGVQRCFPKPGSDLPRHLVRVSNRCKPPLLAGCLESRSHLWIVSFYTFAPSPLDQS